MGLLGAAITVVVFVISVVLYLSARKNKQKQLEEKRRREAQILEHTTTTTDTTDTTAETTTTTSSVDTPRESPDGAVDTEPASVEETISCIAVSSTQTFSKPGNHGYRGQPVRRRKKTAPHTIAFENMQKSAPPVAPKPSAPWRKVTST